MPLNVALLGERVIEQRHRLTRFLPEPVHLYMAPNSLSAAEICELLSGCDAAIAIEFSLPVKELSRLKLLQVAAAGYEKVDFNCLSDRVWVCNAVGHGPAVAEYVLMALLTSSVGVRTVDASFRSGSWARRGSVYRPLREELGSKKVGVLGYGHIGQAIVRTCIALGIATVVCSRSRPTHGEVNFFLPLNSWVQFFQEVDYVVVCLAHTPETEGFIDATKLARMKPTSILINVSRGALIDEAALFVAISNGSIAGAVLDTWWRYPTEDEPDARPSRLPFETLPNVVMTPHVSAWTEQALDRRWRAISENVTSLATGNELRNVVRRALVV